MVGPQLWSDAGFTQTSCAVSNMTAVLVLLSAVSLSSMQAEPLKVCVTGAAGQIAYSLLYSIGNGDIFGKNQVCACVCVRVCVCTLHLVNAF